MTQTLFGRPIELGPLWQDESVYTFTLEPEGAGAAGPAGPLRLQGQGPAFRPNVAVVRMRQDGRTLEAFADEQRAAIAAKLPQARLAREGATTVAGLSAFEREYVFPADAPLPGLAQWHVMVLRDGWFYQFCATSPKERFERDRKSFRALVDSWR